MEENKDFVIDTGMPVTPPAPESQIPEPQVAEPATQEEDAPVAEEPVVEESIVDTPVPEADAVPAPEENVPTPEETVSPQEENGLTLEDIANLIENLQKKFDEKIAVDEHKNGLFDKLYKERDEYKNDLHGKLLKPFITGCLDIINDLKNYISKMETYDVDRSLNYLKTLPEDLVELLENNGVELYAEEGETFNPRTQRAKKIVPTEDPALNNTIAQRIEKGYSWNGVVLRPEMVAVYRAK